MATESKTIRCPQCGSVQKTELGTNRFRCASCDSEYVFDDGQGGVQGFGTTTYTYTSPQGAQARSEPVRPAAPAPGRPAQLSPAQRKALSTTLVLLVLVIALGNYLKNRSQDRAAAAAGAGPATTQPPSLAEQPETWFDEGRALYADSSGRPVLVVAGDRADADQPELRRKYLGFYDIEQGTRLRVLKLHQPSGTDRPQLTAFPGGRVYATFGPGRICPVLTGALRLSDALPHALAAQPELAAGIKRGDATILPGPSGFTIWLANRTWYYAPGPDRLYTPKQRDAALRALENPSRTARLVTRFAFSTQNNTIDDDAPRLYRYTRKDAAGGPEDEPVFQTTDVMNQQDELYRSVFKSGSHLVRTYADATPQRTYIDPKLLYQDSTYVLVSFKKHLGLFAPVVLQCLNAGTGAPVFEQEFRQDVNRFNEGKSIRYPGGFAALAEDVVYLLDLKGTVLRMRSAK